MRFFLFALSVLVLTFVTDSCSNSGTKPGKEESNVIDKIKQLDDGTIDLHIEKASCYSDINNPSSNTAEWNFIVAKAGRYKVWLSSATIDTMDLQYTSSVKISLLDERLEVKPVGDKIVLNASEIKYPYYRADSYMGMFYIQEPGEYSIQVISDKVQAQSSDYSAASDTDHTKLMSVFLTPMTR
jgi:hypothetical protein